MTTPRVFVSHASSDVAFATNLGRDLRQLGADVWMDSSHLGAGDFVDRINDALQRSDVFVLVLTPAAVASQWVRQEMNAAITREKQGLLRALFVVMAEHCPLGVIPPLWTVYNRYDATADYTSALYSAAEKMGLHNSSMAARIVPIPSVPMRSLSTLAQASPSIPQSVNATPHAVHSLVRKTADWPAAKARSHRAQYQSLTAALLFIGSGALLLTGEGFFAALIWLPFILFAWFSTVILAVQMQAWWRVIFVAGSFGVALVLIIVAYILNNAGVSVTSKMLGIPAAAFFTFSFLSMITFRIVEHRRSSREVWRNA